MASYATLAQLREYLDQVRTEIVTPGTDAQLTSILARATGIINQVIAGGLGLATFAYAAYPAASTKIITAYGGAYLSIPALSADSVTLVEEETSFNPVAYTALSAGVWAAQADGRLYRPGMWGMDVRYRVTAVWGYGPVPDAIAEVCLELAVNIWRSRSKGGFTEIVGTEGGGAIRAVAGLTKEHQAILDAIMSSLREIAV